MSGTQRGALQVRTQVRTCAATLVLSDIYYVVLVLGRSRMISTTGCL